MTNKDEEMTKALDIIDRDSLQDLGIKTEEMVSVTDIVQTLVDIASHDASTLVDNSGGLVALKDLPKSTRAAISSIEVNDKGLKVKFLNKLDAIRQLDKIVDLKRYRDLVTKAPELGFKEDEEEMLKRINGLAEKIGIKIQVDEESKGPKIFGVGVNDD